MFVHVSALLSLYIQIELWKGIIILLVQAPHQTRLNAKYAHSSSKWLTKQFVNAHVDCFQTKKTKLSPIKEEKKEQIRPPCPPFFHFSKEMQRIPFRKYR